MNKYTKKLELVDLEELKMESDYIGYALGALLNLEPYITLKDRIRFKKTFKYLEEIYENIDRVIINVTDRSEIDNE